MQAALPGGARGRVLALALTVALLAGLWAGVVAPLMDWYDSRAATLQQRSTLAAHMEELAASLPALARREAAAAANGPPPVAVLEGATDAIAGAALQQRLQEIAAGAGAKLNSLETMQADQRGAYRRIGVRVSLAAPWPVLVALLRAVEDATPRILVDDVQFRASPLRLRPDEPPPMTASLTLYAFRAGGPEPAQAAAADAR
jgi:general secretion pathway protein M